jgi:hypothetical protein
MQLHGASKAPPMITEPRCDLLTTGASLPFTVVKLLHGLIRPPVE